MKKSFIILLLFVSLCLWAQIPQTIDYQGRLADSSGNYLNEVVSVDFLIYDMDIAGTVLWTETQDVNCANGVFHVQLGVVTPLPTTLFNIAAPWLELIVGGETLAPRTEIASVPYSLKAEDAHLLNGLSSTDFMQATTDNWVNTAGDTMTGQLIVQDFVGIGTPTPGRTLTVNSTGSDPIQWQVNSSPVGQLGSNGSGAGGLYLYDNGPITAKVAANGNSYFNGGNVGIGTDAPTSELTVAGTIESTSGGVKFPDGTTQTTASFGDITAVTAGTGLNGGGTTGAVTVNVDVPLVLSSTGPVINATSTGYSHAIFGENTGGSDYSGVYGVSNTQDYYGYGGRFVGGYRGVMGLIYPTGSYSYRGVYGSVSGGSGTNYAVYGYAYGSGTNYAGYFSGNLRYTGTLSGPSDERLKENIQPFKKALTKIKLMDVHTYYYKQMEEEKQFGLPEGKQIGLIAQELEEILPALVSDNVHSYDKNEGVEGAEKDVDIIEYKGINYIGLIPVLIEAMQEQQQQIENQLQLIEELQQQIDDLK